MQTFQTHIEADGRIQLPKEVLDEMDLEIGENLELEIENKSLRVSLTRENKLKKAKDLVRKYVNPEVSLADELIKDRRREAEND